MPAGVGSPGTMANRDWGAGTQKEPGDVEGDLANLK